MGQEDVKLDHLIRSKTYTILEKDAHYWVRVDFSAEETKFQPFSKSGLRKITNRRNRFLALRENIIPKLLLFSSRPFYDSYGGNETKRDD